MSWFVLLESFSKTPSEWNEMPDYQRTFLEEGFKEKQRRRNEESGQQ